jgi:hypothetical protein
MRKKKFKNLSLRDQLARQRNPCPGRSEGERLALDRAMDKFHDHYTYWLTRLDGATPKWLPEYHISNTQEDYFVRNMTQYEGGDRHPDGYMPQLTPKGIRASNKLRVASWYSTPQDDLYMVLGHITSPFECPEWGKRPLGLSTWRRAVLPMIAAHMHWQWVHAVRERFDDPTYQVGGAFGWHLVGATPVKPTRTKIPCTAQVILTPELDKYSARYATA